MICTPGIAARLQARGRPLGTRMRPCAAAVVLGLLAGACATPSTRDASGTAQRPIVSAAEQPMRDLNVMRERTPEILQDAVRAPYAVPNGGCASVRAQSLQLDAELGPDVDAPKPKEGRAQAFAADAVRSVAALPYRGVVRRITGAAARDEARSAAILAGMVRRGYLKGLLQACAG